MTTLYVLDVPENTALAQVAAEDPAVSVGHSGPYFEITASGTITIDRRATGCRHAVWYSAVAGVPRDSRITQHDKNPHRGDHAGVPPPQTGPVPNGWAGAGTSPPGAAPKRP